MYQLAVTFTQHADVFPGLLQSVKLLLADLKLFIDGVNAFM